MDSLLSSVLNTIKRHRMLASGDKVLVAVSGGADSVCLLSALHKLQNSLNITVYCAHFNHTIRGDASDLDEMFVKNLCLSLGIECFTAKSDVLKFAAEKGMTTEEAGRRLRYDFFLDILKTKKLDLVATAHNANDQAETVLMRIIRGTGISGLCAIKYTRDDCVIRPLLDVSRDEIENYCRENGLEYRTDDTNKDVRFTRNKIRNELIPLLKSEYNPNILSSLANLASNAAQETAFADGYILRLYKRLKTVTDKGTCLHIPSISVLDDFIRYGLLKLALTDESDIYKDFQKEHFELILNLLEEKKTGTKIDLPQNIVCEIQYDWVIFYNKKNEPKCQDFCLDVEHGNSYFLEGIQKHITLSVVDKDSYTKKAKELCLSFEKLEGKKLKIRNRRQGDFMIVFGNGGTKKIKDFFIDIKIPRDLRDLTPILVADNEIAAVIPHRVSEKFKVDEHTKKMLVICIK